MNRPQALERLLAALWPAEGAQLKSLAEWSAAAHAEAGETAEPATFAAAALAALQALPQPSDWADRCFTLARLHAVHGALGVAEAVLQRALQIAPQSGAAHTNHALALLELGQVQAALAPALRALELEPGLAAAWHNLGLVRAALGHSAAAAAAHQQAVRLSPASAVHHVRAALELRSQGRLLEAQGALRHAMALEGPTREAWINLATVLIDAGDPQAAEQAARAALQLAPRDRRAASNLLMAQQYQPQLDALTLRESARHWGELWRVPPRPRKGLTLETGRRPLRVAYLGGDFRQHPIGWLLAPVLAAHDPQAVEVHVLDVDGGGQQGDALKARLRACAPHWHEVSGLDDERLCERVLQLGIDVLVEMAGHTDRGRLGVLARRAAPVQLSWLGYFASTGVNGVDAVVVGDAVGDGGSQAWYTEALVHLGRPHFAWLAPPYAPPPATALPCAAGGGITFGSFNNAAKLSDPTVQLWAQVLHAVPGSRLALRWLAYGDPAFAEHTRRRFASQGIASDRVVLQGPLQHAEMLAAYAEIDVALDPTPFSGLITSLEALWMGVPVVTLAGVRPVSRQTEAILGALDCAAWVAPTPQRYVERAAELAHDLGLRSAWRTQARARLAGSSLMDGADLARRLERLYHQRRGPLEVRCA